MTTQPVLSVLAAQARLQLPEERFAEVGALLDVVNDVMQALETLDLDDAQPALSFDARWE